MTLRSSTTSFSRFLDLRPGELTRTASMATFLFFLLAANNVIKIIRDSLFLSRFPITELPYVYLLAALLASAIVGVYSRYTWKFSFSQVVLGSHVFIVSNVVIFWFLVAFYDWAWVLYVFYMWSAIVGLVAVAQFWTLANEIFNSREGKRLFGVLTAAGTLGAVTGGFGANLAVRFLFGTHQLLWFIVVLFAGSFGAAWFAVKEAERAFARTHREAAPRQIQAPDAGGIFRILRESRYLRAIAALLFVSVVVSTLIDYQFKAAAKEAYRSTEALAGFFGSYYAWLSVVTLIVQVWLTGKLFIGFGLTPSLLLLPITLLVGSIGFLVWPGLLTATATRFVEASLRTSVNRTGIEILYLPIPDFIKKKIKVFLDVTVERLGDGTAALIILFYILVFGASEIALLSYFSIGLIVLWATVVFVAQRGYMDAMRRSLAYREVSLKEVQIDYTEKATVEAVLKTLKEKDESTVLFGLDLIEKMDRNAIVLRLPRDLLQHPSPEVRARAIKLFATGPDATILSEIKQMLQDENTEVQAQAINAACAIFKGEAIAVVRPYVESKDVHVKTRAVECLLRHGDAVVREMALKSIQKMVYDNSAEGEQGRAEACRLMGEVYQPEFSAHLDKLIREDSSTHVIHEAMAAAGKRKYPEVVGQIVSRLGRKDTRGRAREALIEYGELAVKGLSTALLDSSAARDVRLNIPRTLSKIHSQAAMNVLLKALLQEDRSLRFQAVHALEEMARHFADLTVDRGIVESAIMSDATLYNRRFVFFVALFGQQEKPLPQEESPLYFGLTNSMDRVKERVIWLLSLIYPAKDIRRFWAALNSEEPNKKADAVEFLDNLLTGEIKAYAFPLFSDAPQAQRFRASLGFLSVNSIDTVSALRALLDQDDIWLRAATVWEIGIRRLTGFRDQIVKFLDSDEIVLREAAGKAINDI